MERGQRILQFEEKKNVDSALVECKTSTTNIRNNVCSNEMCERIGLEALELRFSICLLLRYMLFVQIINSTITNDYELNSDQKRREFTFPQLTPHYSMQLLQFASVFMCMPFKELIYFHTH